MESLSIFVQDGEDLKIGCNAHICFDFIEWYYTKQNLIPYKDEHIIRCTCEFNLRLQCSIVITWLKLHAYLNLHIVISNGFIERHVSYKH